MKPPIRRQDRTGSGYVWECYWPGDSCGEGWRTGKGKRMGSQREITGCRGSPQKGLELSERLHAEVSRGPCHGASPGMEVRRGGRGDGGKMQKERKGWSKRRDEEVKDFDWEP